jgi:Na+-driven multidrug efflux pump
VAVALAVVQMRDLFSAAMLFAIYSLLSAALFVVLDAGDVALTVTFIRVFGLGVAGFSVSRTLRGGLRGAGHCGASLNRYYLKTLLESQSPP